MLIFDPNLDSLTKILIFAPNLYFRPKFRFFDKNFDFWFKFRFFVKNFDFLPKFRFLIQIYILTKFTIINHSFKFLPKFRLKNVWGYVRIDFYLKLSIFVKFYYFQIYTKNSNSIIVLQFFSELFILRLVWLNIWSF